MLALILIVLIVLWFLGYGPIQAFSVDLFNLFGHTVTLWDILIFLLITSLIGVLPSPFRQIAAVAVILYLLSIFGIFAITGLSSLIVLAVIGGLVLYILRIA